MTPINRNFYLHALCLIALLSAMSCSLTPNQRVPSSSEIYNSLNKSLGPKTTRILIWNTYKGKRDQFSLDASELIAAHDIVLFQEVIFNDFFRELMRDNGRLEIEESVSWGDNGVANAAKTNSLETVPIQTKVREFGIFTRKASLFTTYKIKTPQGEQKELLVLNVHMINFRTSWGFEKNLEQYRQKLQEHEGPILAAGDFNTWSQTRHDMVVEFFREFGLEEVEFEWDGFRDPRDKSLFGILDRAFTRGLDVHWGLVYEDIHSSDHNPFALGVTVRP